VLDDHQNAGLGPYLHGHVVQRLTDCEQLCAASGKLARKVKGVILEQDLGAASTPSAKETVRTPEKREREREREVRSVRPQRQRPALPTKGPTPRTGTPRAGTPRKSGTPRQGAGGSYSAAHM
ncbi:hypothetical protein KIPB_008696, partial [Kipferlia bialata]